VDAIGDGLSSEADDLGDHTPTSSPSSESASEEAVGAPYLAASEYDASELEPDVADRYLEAAEAAVPNDDEFRLDAAFADLGPALTRLLPSARPVVIPAAQEVIIGQDDRVRIAPTTSFPWRAICSLQITAQDNSKWIGTGFLVGRRTLITAGHCVYMHAHGGWVKSVRVIPGRDAAKQPFGACTATILKSVTGWTSGHKREYDYGAIVLPLNCLFGQKVGYFGVAALSNASLQNKTANLSGYPGDKPSGTQWYHARGIKKVNSQTLVYDVDTAGGQSGAPVWLYNSGKRTVVGIHTNGHLQGNSATRVVAAVYQNIVAWAAL
jgi:V8-like Glu-specific endopeptidase